MSGSSQARQVVAPVLRHSAVAEINASGAGMILLINAHEQIIPW